MFRAFAGPARVTWALLLVFPAVYFYLINGWGFMFARYALPAVPFIAIWAAIAVDRLAARLARVPGDTRRGAPRHRRYRPPGDGPRSDWLNRVRAGPRYRDDAGAGLGVDEEIDLAELRHSLRGPRAGSAC